MISVSVAVAVGKTKRPRAWQPQRVLNRIVSLELCKISSLTVFKVKLYERSAAVTE